MHFRSEKQIFVFKELSFIFFIIFADIYNYTQRKTIIFLHKNVCHSYIYILYKLTEKYGSNINFSL